MDNLYEPNKKPPQKQQAFFSAASAKEVVVLPRYLWLNTKSEAGVLKIQYIGGDAFLDEGSTHQVIRAEDSCVNANAVVVFTSKSEAKQQELSQWYYREHENLEHNFKIYEFQYDADRNSKILFAPSFVELKQRPLKVARAEFQDKQLSEKIL